MIKFKVYYYTHVLLKYKISINIFVYILFYCFYSSNILECMTESTEKIIDPRTIDLNIAANKTLVNSHIKALCETPRCWPFFTSSMSWFDSSVPIKAKTALEISKTLETYVSDVDTLLTHYTKTNSEIQTRLNTSIGYLEAMGIELNAQGKGVVSRIQAETKAASSAILIAETQIDATNERLDDMSKKLHQLINNTHTMSMSVKELPTRKDLSCIQETIVADTKETQKEIRELRETYLEQQQERLSELPIVVNEEKPITDIKIKNSKE